MEALKEKKAATIHVYKHINLILVNNAKVMLYKFEWDTFFEHENSNIKYLLQF